MVCLGMAFFFHGGSNVRIFFQNSLKGHKYLFRMFSSLFERYCDASITGQLNNINFTEAPCLFTIAQHEPRQKSHSKSTGYKQQRGGEGW